MTIKFKPLSLEMKKISNKFLGSIKTISKPLKKKTTIALLNDDLKNHEHDNMALQGQRDVYKEQLQKCQDIITHLKKRYVPHAKDPGKDDY